MADLTLHTKNGPDSIKGYQNGSVKPGVPLNSKGEVAPNGGYKVGYEQFLNWIDEDAHAEWVDGVIIMTSPASIRHQTIKNFLETTLTLFVRAHNLGIVLSAGTQMRLPTSGREPDVIFVNNQHLGWLQPTFLQGPADIAVEIVSPESVERDYEAKFNEYQSGGVPEYWLIDAIRDTAIFYRRQNGQFQVIPLDGEGRYYSQVLPGFWLKPAWLWRQPLPDPVEVLKRVGGPALLEYFNRSPEADDL